MLIEKEYNIDEVNPPTSLTIRGYIFKYQFAWCQIDIFDNCYSSNNFFVYLFKDKIIKEIIKECKGKKIKFYNIKNKKVFLKNNFKNINGILIYET